MLSLFSSVKRLTLIWGNIYAKILVPGIFIFIKPLWLKVVSCRFFSTNRLTFIWENICVIIRGIYIFINMYRIQPLWSCSLSHLPWKGTISYWMRIKPPVTEIEKWKSFNLSLFHVKKHLCRESKCESNHQHFKYKGKYSKKMALAFVAHSKIWNIPHICAWGKGIFLIGKGNLLNREREGKLMVVLNCEQLAAAAARQLLHSRADHVRPWAARPSVLSLEPLSLCLEILS